MKRTRQAEAKRRRLLLLGGIVAAASLAGYLLTCAIYPAPILPRQVSVPQLRGTSTENALSQLARLSLHGRVTDTTRDPLLPAGAVVWQSPAPETMLPEGALVKLAMNGGAPTVTVPDLNLLDIDLATDVLQAAGLKPGVVDTVPHSEEFGTVLSIDPAAGTAVRPGRAIDITISSGPASVKVPDLTGLPLGVARDRLTALGLRVGTLEQRFEGKAGTVLGQSPGAGEMLTRGSAVNLTISGAME